MSNVTGVELGPNSCVLVRTGSYGSAARTSIAAARVVSAGEWSEDLEALGGVLRQARRTHQFPRRARVVAWDLAAVPEGSRIPGLAAFEAAGFEIEAVLSPAQALARVVFDRAPSRPGEAVAALALYSQGFVITIVSGTDILVSRSIAWPLGKPFSRGHSEQLERYLIVSQLAPHLQHLIDLVRPVYGVAVTSAVACGNVPDLRSLMMLLIDEIDVEVDTLDSIDLVPPPAADERLGGLGDAAAALQLPSAAATFGEPSVQRQLRSPVARAARHASQALLAVATVALCVTWSVLEISGTSPATPAFSAGTATIAAIPPVPDLPTEATIGRTGEGRLLPAEAKPAEESVRTEPLAVRPRSAPGAPALPHVSGVMISGDRRLAIVSGEVVEPGDRVHGRTVLRIERDGVVFREPSGRDVAVPIRPRGGAL